MDNLKRHGILKRIPLSVKLLSLLFMLTVGLIAVMLIAYTSIGSLKTGLVNVYFGDMIPIKQLESISDNYSHKIAWTIEMTRQRIIPPGRGLEELLVTRAAIARDWDSYKKKYHDPEETELINVASARMLTADAYLDRVEKIYKDGHVWMLANADINNAIEPVLEALKNIIENEYIHAESEKDRAYETHAFTERKLLIASGTIFALIILLSAPILNSIRRTQHEFEVITNHLNVTNQKLIEEQENLAQFIEFLSTLQSVDLDLIAESSLRRIVKASNAQIGLVYRLINDTELKLLHSITIDNKTLDSRIFTITEDGLPYAAIESKKKMTITDFDEDSQPFIGTGLFQVRIKRVTAYPLVFKEIRIGVVVLASASSRVNRVEKDLLPGYIGALTQALNNAISYSTITEQSAQLISANEKLTGLTITDPLTGLYNRRYLEQVMKKEMDRARRDNKDFGFLMLDIDFFKQYNDTYGHPAGDEVIKAVGRVLTKSLKRPGDMVFRMGGEEFGAFFSGLDEIASLEFINGIRKRIEALHLRHEKSQVSGYVTASIGIAMLDITAEHETMYEELISSSDKALYRAKKEGRNRVSLWEPCDAA